MIRIGIADDHVLFRKGVVGLIEDFSDIEVNIKANNGKELLKALQTTKHPDIVILDINMPIMNGYETAVLLRKQHPKIKILALSMYVDESSIIRMLKSGADGYILKDAEPSELEQALNDLMSKGFYYSNEVGQLLLNNVQSDRSVLSERENEFLEFVATELTYKEIADKMCVSPRTVDGYREALFEKLGVKSRVGLVVYAIKHGIYKLD
jgi:DNA-binding NarL/FixJ family response regulator